MKTDISVSIVGLPVSRASSITVTYGLNMIPEMALTIDPNQNALAANIDAYRRTPVVVTVNTKNGGFTFNGVLDGLSISCQFGQVIYTAIIKSKFQKLLEFYPIFPGINPTGVDIFRINDYIQDQVITGGLPAQGSLFTDIPTGGSPVNVYMQYLKKMILFQKAMKSVTGLQADPKGLNSGLLSSTTLVNCMTNVPDSEYDNALKLIDEIDYSAVSNFNVHNFSPDGVYTSGLLRLLVKNSSTVWNSLLAGMGQLGCNIVIGNNKIYIIPSNNFLNLDPPPPGETHGARSQQPNVAWPAEYTSFYVNDNGFLDFSQCFVAPGSNLYDKNASPNLIGGVGYYQDSEAAKKTNGILVLEDDTWITELFVNGLSSTSYADAKKLAPGQSYVTLNAISGVPVDVKAILQNETAPHDEALKLLGLNSLAQLLYYERKYQDRTGSLLVEFSNTWVPGSAASIYSRVTGQYVNCFVNAVTHNFSMSDGGGTALTTISFQSARASSVSGFDNDLLYEYSTDDMKSYQHNFIQDITGGAPGSVSNATDTSTPAAPLISDLNSSSINTIA